MAHDRRFAGFGKLGGAQTGYRILGLVVQEILLAGTGGDIGGGGGSGGCGNVIGRTDQSGLGMLGHDKRAGLLQQGSVMH